MKKMIITAVLAVSFSANANAGLVLASITHQGVNIPVIDQVTDRGCAVDVGLAIGLVEDQFGVKLKNKRHFSGKGWRKSQGYFNYMGYNTKFNVTCYEN